MKPTSALRSFLLCCSSLLVVHAAHAQQIYWLGTTDGNFNADNWTNVTGTAMVSSLVPVNNDIVNFDTSETNFSDVAGSFTVNNDIVGLSGLTLAITDNSATGDFNISGNAITIGTGGISSNVLNGTGSTLAFGGTGITLDAASQFYANFGALTINSDVVNGGNLLTVTGGGATSITGAITGLGGLERTNSGSLTLSGTNSYGGGTTITNGTVNFTKLLAMPASGAVAVQTGTTLGIKVGGAGEWTTGTSGNGTVGGLLAGLGGQVGGTVSYTGNVSLALDNSTTQTYSGAIPDVGTSLSLVKNGSGQLTLNTLANTYSGTTTVNAGKLVAALSTSLGSSPNVTVNSAGTLQVPTMSLNLALNGGKLAVGSSTVSGTITLGTATTSTFDITGDVTPVIAANITGSGNLNKTGTGHRAVSLTGTNDYSGTTTISAGNLQFNTPASLYNDTPASWTPANITVASGALLGFRLGGATGFDNTDMTTLLANLTTVNNNGLLNGSFLMLDTGNGSFDLSANITDSTGTGGGSVGVRAYGGNTLTLSGNNTYSGKTILQGFNTTAITISVSSFNSVDIDDLDPNLPMPNSSLGRPTTVANGTIDMGGTFQAGQQITYTGPGETTDRVINFIPNGNGATKTLNASGAGLLRFTSTVTKTGATTTNDVALAGNGAGQLDGGLPIVMRNFSKSGTGKWILSGPSGWTGTTAISGGLLVLNHANVIPGGLGATGGTTVLSLSGGGILGLTAASGNFSRARGTTVEQVQWTGSGGFAAFGGNRTVDLGGAAATAQWATGSFVPGGQSLILSHADADGTLIWENPINFAGSLRTIQVNNGSAAIDARINGAFSGGGSSGLNKTGAGTLEITSTTSTYPGATTVADGTLRLGASNVLPDTTNVTIAAATLEVGAGFTDSTGTGTLDVTAGATINPKTELG